jgi:hypothetical protein
LRPGDKNCVPLASPISFGIFGLISNTMGDEEPQVKVEYLDVPEGGDPEETNWIKRAGKCRVTYVNGCIFEGSFDDEKIKQGKGMYIWMGPGTEEDETPVEKARFEGEYKDGMRTGVGKFVYPNGDVYEGEFFENKMSGEGSYTYKATGDIYSGGWVDGKKHGQGVYEFSRDSSMMSGTWDAGSLVTGSWILKGAGQYDGNFNMGRPYGTGKYSFPSGLQQTGSYADKPKGEDEEEPAEGDAPVPPNVEWKGDTIVAF